MFIADVLIAMPLLATLVLVGFVIGLFLSTVTVQRPAPPTV